MCCKISDSSKGFLKVGIVIHVSNTVCRDYTRRLFKDFYFNSVFPALFRVILPSRYTMEFVDPAIWLETHQQPYFFEGEPVLFAKKQWKKTENNTLSLTTFILIDRERFPIYWTDILYRPYTNTRLDLYGPWKGVGVGVAPVGFLSLDLTTSRASTTVPGLRCDKDDPFLLVRRHLDLGSSITTLSLVRKEPAPLRVLIHQVGWTLSSLHSAFLT